eukprot:GHVT01060103.1.p1 GENE.GHVT01060103.1~~GHVT01060103.1.p1  ORF type:complete len:534 (-),score=158.28 GHVT01060103.1:1764-3365(-)
MSYLPDGGGVVCLVGVCAVDGNDGGDSYERTLSASSPGPHFHSNSRAQFGKCSRGISVGSSGLKAEKGSGALRTRSCDFATSARAIRRRRRLWREIAQVVQGSDEGGRGIEHLLKSPHAANQIERAACCIYTTCSQAHWRKQNQRRQCQEDARAHGNAVAGAHGDATHTGREDAPPTPAAARTRRATDKPWRHETCRTPPGTSGATTTPEGEREGESGEEAEEAGASMSKQDRPFDGNNLDAGMCRLSTRLASSNLPIGFNPSTFSAFPSFSSSSSSSSCSSSCSSSSSSSSSTSFCFSCSSSSCSSHSSSSCSASCSSSCSRASCALSCACVAAAPSQSPRDPQGSFISYPGAVDSADASVPASCSLLFTKDSCLATALHSFPFSSSSSGHWQFPVSSSSSSPRCSSSSSCCCRSFLCGPFSCSCWSSGCSICSSSPPPPPAPPCALALLAVPALRRGPRRALAAPPVPALAPPAPPAAAPLPPPAALALDRVRVASACLLVVPSAARGAPACVCAAVAPWVAPQLQSTWCW